MGHILIIDDEAAVRGHATRLLERAGHVVSTAADGVEGLRSHRTHPADLVITDIMMPEKDGLETIRALREEDASVPIIAITGNEAARDVGFLAYAREFGADRTATKPMHTVELVETVAELLGDASS